MGKTCHYVVHSLASLVRELSSNNEQPFDHIVPGVTHAFIGDHM